MGAVATTGRMLDAPGMTERAVTTDVTAMVAIGARRAGTTAVISAQEGGTTIGAARPLLRVIATTDVTTTAMIAVHRPMQAPALVAYPLLQTRVAVVIVRITHPTRIAVVMAATLRVATIIIATRVKEPILTNAGTIMTTGAAETVGAHRGRTGVTGLEMVAARLQPLGTRMLRATTPPLSSPHCPRGTFVVWLTTGRATCKVF